MPVVLCVPARRNADDRVARDGLPAAKQVDRAAEPHRGGVVGRRRERPDPAEVVRRAAEDLRRGAPADEAAEDEHAPAADRDGGEAGRGFRQTTYRGHLEDRRGRGTRWWGRPDDLCGQEVDAVGLRQVPRSRRGDPSVAVLPDDPLRARIDQDHPVVVVVVGGDQPVGQADGERRLVQEVRPRVGAERPGDPAGGRQLDDPAGIGERGDEDVPVREQLRVGGVADRRTHRPDEPAAAVEPVDVAADLGHEQAAAGKRSVAVRAREAGRRVVRAAPAEHPHDAAARGQLDHPAVADVGDRDVAARELVGIVGRVQVAGRRAENARMAIPPEHLFALQRQLGQRVVELLVRHDRMPAGREERVVGAGEVVVAPDDLAGRRHDQQAVVVAVGDHQVAGKRPRRHGREPEREPGRIGARRRSGMACQRCRRGPPGRGDGGGRTTSREQHSPCEGDPTGGRHLSRCARRRRSCRGTRGERAGRSRRRSRSPRRSRPRRRPGARGCRPAAGR